MAMINCPECGAQISNMAQACPKCGRPVYGAQGNMVNQNFPVYAKNSNEHSAAYPQVRAYADAVQSAFVLSIIGVILCMGIGIIFAFIGIAKLRHLPLVDEASLSPFEQAEYQSARRKLNTVNTLNVITSVGFVLAIIIGVIIGVTSYL